MQAKDFRRLSYLLSLFTPQVNFSNNKILTSLMAEFGEILDGQIITLPLPPDAPAEIPRITLPSADQSLKLEVAPGRVNFFCLRKLNEPDIDVAKFLAVAEKIFSKYLAITNAVVGRMASVAVKYLEMEAPGIELAQHFCKKEWMERPVLNRPENFELHAHKRYKLGAFDVNSWVRNKTGSLQPSNKSTILLEQDLNTLSEELQQKHFTIEEICVFQQLASKEHESIIEKYYP